jgi:uncharacterized protein
MACPPSGGPLQYLLFYAVTADYLEQCANWRDEHLALAWQAPARGERVLGGVLANPVAGARLLFGGAVPATAAQFVVAYPYVRAGLVRRWWVREWTMVVGAAAATPVQLSRSGGTAA